MPREAKANQTDYTIRFKNHTTTIVLLCNPTQPFTSIKEDLLEAISATGIKEINGSPIPSDPDDVILGVQLDREDIGKPWVNLEIPEFDDEEAPTKKGVKKGSVLNKNPLGAGLKDGSLLAFRFRSAQKFDPNSMEVDDDWDVVLPKIYEGEPEEDPSILPSIETGDEVSE
ncbi:MAG: hypothetical protein OHK93_001352 [Ramalina farinacea]|uniref:Uncharacterized protein n=1 Tax=Ramalina farinacea TaxID=258253 RepID=A0AA43QPD6_9LECA|nr:hypothetical protein [Ramalina farinacea]